MPVSFAAGLKSQEQVSAVSGQFWPSVGRLHAQTSYFVIQDSPQNTASPGAKMITHNRFLPAFISAKRQHNFMCVTPVSHTPLVSFLSISICYPNKIKLSGIAAQTTIDATNYFNLPSTHISTLHLLFYSSISTSDGVLGFWGFL